MGKPLEAYFIAKDQVFTDLDLSHAPIKMLALIPNRPLCGPSECIVSKPRAVSQIAKQGKAEVGP